MVTKTTTSGTLLALGVRIPGNALHHVTHLLLNTARAILNTETIADMICEHPIAIPVPEHSPSAISPVHLVA